MKIVVVGDTLVDSDYMARQAELILPSIKKEIIKYDWKVTSKENFQTVMLNIEKNGPSSEKFRSILKILLLKMLIYL